MAHKTTSSHQFAGDACDVVEAVRVHGAEGLRGIVGLHTPDLPHSLAWLSPEEELTFGELDPNVQLRWFTLGMHCT